MTAIQADFARVYGIRPHEFWDLHPGELLTLWAGLPHGTWWEFLVRRDLKEGKAQRLSKDMTPEEQRRAWQKAHGASIARRPKK